MFGAQQWFYNANALSAADFVGPFDGYSFTAGYSLRRLKSDYTGDAIIAERSSDNATQSIGFDSNGDLDESSLTTFAGTYSAYVTKWYDQSGNDYHVVLGTYSAEGAQIVVSGVVATMSGCSISRPTTKWRDGHDDKLIAYRNGDFSQTQPATNFGAVRLRTTSMTSPNRAPVIWDSRDVGQPRHFLYQGGFENSSQWAAIVTSSISSGSSLDTNPRIMTALYNGASSALRANGTQIASGNVGSGTHTGLKIGNVRNAYPLGATLTNSYQWEGDMSELIFFESDESSNYSTIEGKINTYFGLY